MSIEHVSEKEQRLAHHLAEAQRIIERLVGERDALKADLVFVERWANHHGTKSCHSAESILGVIQHYPTIRAITKSYADGVAPSTPDPYAERDTYQVEADKLAMENKVLRDAVHSCGPTCSKAGCINRRLRDALKDIESGTYDTWSEGYRAQQIAHAALQGANHE